MADEDPDRRDAYAALIDDYYARIDTAAKRVADLHSGRLVCQRGCSACCLDDLTVSPVEAERIRLAHPALLREAVPHSRGACAFLDQEGACRIYGERPAVCRSQGLPLRVLFEDDCGEIAERRDICELNVCASKPLDKIPEDDCWLLGPFELELGAIEEGRFGDGAERIGLRSLFVKNED